jgi:hypothetical protein
MENPQHKQNARVSSLLNRMQRKGEIKNKIIEIISTEENLAIEDTRDKIGLNRNTFNYWIKMFEKEKWLNKKIIKCEGVEKRGNPKTLVLNKKFIEWQETLRKRSWESYEEKQLETLLIERILEEIDKKQLSDKQHQKLIKLFKEFNQESFGAKLIFLLYDDYVKLDYKLSLTKKGKKELEKIKKRNKTK